MPKEYAKEYTKEYTKQNIIKPSGISWSVNYVNSRGVFGTLSNILNGFVKIVNNYFFKKLHLRCFAGF